MKMDDVLPVMVMEVIYQEHQFNITDGQEVMHMEYILVFTVTSVMMIQTYTHTEKTSIMMKGMLENSYTLMNKPMWEQGV